MKTKHVDFNLSECGLLVDNACPLLAASPDGIRMCACHGKGLVEVKCSYKYRDCFIGDISDMDTSFYLDDCLNLKPSHRYFTQIQFQMYVSECLFTDFVVFTNKGIVVNTIDYDPIFCANLVSKCVDFSRSFVLPEILSKKRQL